MSNSFTHYGVPTDLSAVLNKRGISVPTAIQAATLPDSFAGRDVLGRGRTGSGKTYAFLLPLVERLRSPGHRAQNRQSQPGRPRAMILAPTRELVGQIMESLQPLAEAAGLSSCTIFGGVGQNPQVAALRRGVDIIVACPGRLEDLIGQRHCSLAAVEITVIDEADYMADLGFLPGVKRLLSATAPHGQRLLFSATLDSGVNVLVKQFLNNPVTHHADSPQSPVATMTHHVLQVERDTKLAVLTDLLQAPGRSIVFTRTKHTARKLARKLNSEGVPAVDLHGNLSQGARTRNLDAFHTGKATTLVATDIAARGIHVDDVALVIHSDPPMEHKAYLHRSGRTARAGAAGTVVTLMTNDQVSNVRSLTRAAGIKATTTKVSAGHPLLATIAPGERIFSKGLEPGELAGGSAARPQRNGQKPRNAKKRPQKRSNHSGQNSSQTGSWSGSRNSNRAGKPAGNRDRVATRRSR